jgi:hypothetical protein
VFETDRRHLLVAKLLGRREPAMTGNNLTASVDQDRVGEPELAQARLDLVDLLLGVGARVVR